MTRRKRVFYGPGDELWRRFLSICRREGSSGSERLTDYIRRYVEIHGPGNPQTVMNSYAEKGSITHELKFGTDPIEAIHDALTGKYIGEDRAKIEGAVRAQFNNYR